MSARFNRYLGLTALLVSTATALADRTVIVAADGSGDFTTVQAAVDAAASASEERQIIHLRPGTYRERVTVPKNKPRLAIVGNDPTTTIISWNWNAKSIGAEGKPVGTSGSSTVTLRGSDFIADNITFENTAGDNGQAVALAAVADRQVFTRCRLIGWQDTLYANAGRQCYRDCYIEGRVDFIFGSATAVFDHCQLHSKRGSYVTAASTPKESPWGYVFFDCKVTGEGDAKTYLGRPWRPDAAVAFIRCELGAHIDLKGWDNWRNAANEATARYFESDCTGPGADRNGRVAWSKVLTSADAEKLSPSAILSGDDHWTLAPTTKP